ncbi:MAG: hypothetical protein H6814_11560 [Phycisphaeraceae bacterium]|nr:hypothetical protein [Phycisphaeraceae bacterium]
MRSAHALAIASLALTGAAMGGIDATWPFDLETTGSDVTWDSTTAINPAAGRFKFVYEITAADADGSLGGLPLGTFDVLSMIPPEQLSDVGYAQGPAPVTVWSSHIDAPAPPEAPAVSADVLITVDGSGFAHMSMTNVTLGTATVNVPPFGTVMIDITRIHMSGTITAEVAACAADLNIDGVVDTADLGILLGQFGTDNEQGDINDDDVVDTADLGILLGQFGVVCSFE